MHTEMSSNRGHFNKFQIEKIKQKNKGEWSDALAKTYMQELLQSVLNKIEIGFQSKLKAWNGLAPLSLSLDLDEVIEGRVRRKVYNKIKRTESFKIWASNQADTQHNLCY